MPLSFGVLSTTGPVRAAEAEEGRDSREEAAEGLLRLPVPVLCRLFRGHQGAEAEVHRVAAEVPLCLLSPVRPEAEAVLRKP